MVAQTRVAPRVVIAGRCRTKLLRCEEMIEPPAAAVATYALPRPAGFPVGITVQGSESVLVTKFPKARNYI